MTVFSFIKQQLLRVPAIVYYCLLFAAKAALEVKNFSLSPDISHQLHSVANLGKGHGISIVHWTDAGISYYKYSYNAAGLALVLSPINFILSNTLYSVISLSFLCTLLFCLFLRKTIILIEVDNYLERLIILFFVVAISPFVYDWPADNLATIISLWGIYFSIKHIILKQEKYLFISCLLFAFAYLVKYSFFPLLFFPLLANFTLYHKFSKQNFFLWSRCVTTAICAGCIAFLINYAFVGTRTEEVRPIAKIYPQHLLKSDGMLFHFGNYDYTIEKKLNAYLKSPSPVVVAEKSMTVLLISVFLFILIRRLKQAERKEGSTLVLIAALTSLFLLYSLLAGLSIVSPLVLIDGKPWTYVENTRYYSPAVIMCILATMIIAYRKLPSWLAGGLLIIFLLLNTLSFRSLLKVGNFGSDFFTYSRLQQKIQAIRLAQSPRSVVFYDTSLKNTNDYYVLLATGVKVVPKGPVSEYRRHEAGYDCYELVRRPDSSSSLLIKNAATKIATKTK
jgi:hypothetical protein